MSEINRESDPSQAEHEALCAYVLGELQGEEREAMTQRLEGDAELRAERERLDATIGLLRDSLPEVGLSPEMQAKLVTAAESQRDGSSIPAGWRFLRGGGAAWKAAAAILVVVGAGYGTTKLFDKAPTTGGPYQYDLGGMASSADAGESEESASSFAPGASLDASVDAGEPVLADSESTYGYKGMSDAKSELDKNVRFSTAMPDGTLRELEALGYSEGTSERGVDSLYRGGREPKTQAGDVALERSDMLLKEAQLGAELSRAGGETKNLVARAEGIQEQLKAADDATRLQFFNKATKKSKQADPAQIQDQLRSLGYIQGGEQAAATRYRGRRAPGEQAPARESLERKNLVDYARVPASGEVDLKLRAELGALQQGVDQRGLSLALSDERFGGGHNLGWDFSGRSWYQNLNALGLEADEQAQVVELYGRALGRRPVDAPVEVLHEAREALRDLGGETVSEDSDEVRRLKEAIVREEERIAAQNRIVLNADERAELSGILIGRCGIREHETPSTMFFRCWGDNPFELTLQDAQSTFGADVDTASYALARRTLNGGMFPQKEQIRTEEFVNYFKPDVDPPRADDVFRIQMEMAPSRFNSDPNVSMLRVTLRGKDIDKVDRQALALTFVVDVSGSMKDEGRLGMVKDALKLLVHELYPNDSIALVVFNKEARVVSPMVSASNRGQVEDALFALEPGGGTNIENGLQTGYALAAEALTPNAVNRVILLSDGVGNVGETDQERILASVQEHKDKGIYLNTIGVGLENLNDAFLEQLADKGDGICNYVHSAKDAKKVMVHDFTSTLQPIARDVKIQVEFDPAQVESYRQIGYENRAIADADFRNDAVDAGELNAGHQVTALYEVKLHPSSTSHAPLAKANVRYKPPFAVDQGEMSEAAREAAEKATEINTTFYARDGSASYEASSLGYQRAILVAQFAEFLRQSVHARGDSLPSLIQDAEALRPQLNDPDFDEFCELLALAAPRLGEILGTEPDELARVMDDLSRVHFEKGQRIATGGVTPGGTGTELDDEVRRLEDEIRRLVDERFGEKEKDPDLEER